MHTEHNPVLLNEVLDNLAIHADGIYIDATFGRGGHSLAILQKLSTHGRLLAIDKDLEAISYAKESIQDSRFQVYHGSFIDLFSILQAQNLLGKIHGILLDLGVSSPQLNNPHRGFSFMQDGPLDMRMNTQQKLSAEVFINNASINDMATIFQNYGEERFAYRIAKAIYANRKLEPIRTTKKLTEIILKAHPKWEKYKHPATRVFQAIRIHVNQELTDLYDFLQNVLPLLKIQGRLAIISFHSLEDRIVKNFMANQSQGNLPIEIPYKEEEIIKSLKKIGKAIKPKAEEVKKNIRSRSAILRVGEKVA